MKTPKLNSEHKRGKNVGFSKAGKGERPYSLGGTTVHPKTHKN